MLGKICHEARPEIWYVCRHRTCARKNQELVFADEFCAAVPKAELLRLVGPDNDYGLLPATPAHS